MANAIMYRNIKTGPELPAGQYFYNVYNIKNTYSYSPSKSSNTTKVTMFGKSASNTYNITVYYARSYTFDATTGKYTLISPYQAPLLNIIFDSNVYIIGYSWSIGNLGVSTSGSSMSQIDHTYGPKESVDKYGNTDDFYEVYIYRHGNTSTIISQEAGEFVETIIGPDTLPENGISGDKWYIRL